MIQVAVVGGSGYTGIELLRLLSQHSQVEVSAVTSRSEVGIKLVDYYPSLLGQPTLAHLAFVAPDVETLSQVDLVFFATPNGTAMQLVPELLQKGVKVIDLAADFRIKSPALWEKWYGMPHACPELIEQAVYGLADVPYDDFRVDSTTQLVANPGCYPTAVQLALMPLIRAGIVDLTQAVIADCKSGISGAGRSGKVAQSYSEVEDNFQAYGVTGHRHLPEIKQGLGGETIPLSFTPHLLPMARGILATIYFQSTETQRTQVEKIRALLHETYDSAPFVQVLNPGQMPQTKSVRSSNQCHINVFERPDGGLVMISVIDNLVKGAAGQAIQNMNKLFGFDQSLGLMTPGLVP